MAHVNGGQLMVGNKPKLYAVQVPWKVSPSTPFLRLSASEAQSSPVEVTFVAYFGFQDELRSQATDTVKIVQAPVDVEELSGFEAAPYQLLLVTFRNGFWVRMYPSHSDSEVIEEAAYDSSAVGGQYLPGEKVEEWLQRFHDEWRRTRVCPDPRMYEVRDSFWLDETRASEHGYRHYLILGHDAYIEVIAQDWSWKSKGSIKNW